MRFLKKNKIKKKYGKFYFRRRSTPSNFKIGKLHLRCTYSNIFITLTDLKNQAIKCHTSGRAFMYITKSKRRKITPHAIENIMWEFVPVIDKYKITHVIVVLKVARKAFGNFLLKELKYHNLGVYKVIIKKRVAFNGMRGKKLRRI